MLLTQRLIETAAVAMIGDAFRHFGTRVLL